MRNLHVCRFVAVSLALWLWVSNAGAQEARASDDAAIVQ
jgi:hypothetical protein